MEKHYPIAGRGVLIDLAAACGVEAMKAGAGATIADVKQALQRNTMPVSLVSAWMWHAGWPGTCTLG